MRTPPLILIVDDERDLSDVASLKLKASGFDTLTADSARSAVVAAVKEHPDLILMDIHMPGESGTDAALEIKQNPATADIKIAFLSSMQDPWPSTFTKRDELSAALGMVDFIDKTDDLNKLVARVRVLLGIVE
jgi:CheY-like chemotaxis protein